MWVPFRRPGVESGQIHGGSIGLGRGRRTASPHTPQNNSAREGNLSQGAEYLAPFRICFSELACAVSRRFVGGLCRFVSSSRTNSCRSTSPCQGRTVLGSYPDISPSLRPEQAAQQCCVCEVVPRCRLWSKAKEFDVMPLFLGTGSTPLPQPPHP